MYYRFSIDDNIWFLRDINSKGYDSIFENPYLGFFKNLHEKYGARFQFNVYYETEGFDLSEMTDRYRDEWRENSDWLRLSFHGRYDIGEPPYINSSYEEAFEDCQSVHREILRFAGEDTLSYFTTIHYCQGSPEALRAFYDCGIRGLVGLFEDGRYCYQHSYPDFTEPYKYESEDDIYYFVNDMIINLFGLGGVVPHLEGLSHKEFLEVMIHEQYFYKDYPYHQPDFCEKVERVVKHLTESGRKSVFLEELLER
ncbi:MAG: hypothetical protein IJA52_01785 [Clostridia bacterium]|nr:hypothetical protein [Clostridia bacterium]